MVVLAWWRLPYQFKTLLKSTVFINVEPTLLRGTHLTLPQPHPVHALIPAFTLTTTLQLQEIVSLRRLPTVTHYKMVQLVLLLNATAIHIMGGTHKQERVIFSAIKS